MPCRSGLEYEDCDNQARELNKVTRLLCHVLGRLEKIKTKSQIANDILEGNDELINWWNAHQEKDRIRLEEEKEKTSS